MIVRWKIPGAPQTGSYVLSGRQVSDQVNTSGAISTAPKQRGFTINVGRMLRSAK